MDNKLYVGNLAYSVSDAELQKLFTGAGEVKSATVIKDRDSGRSKGFGFVEMATADEAQAAIRLYHGQEFQGRTLTVNIARPREDRPSQRGGGYQSRGGGSKRRDADRSRDRQRRNWDD